MVHFTPERFNESFLGMLLGRAEQLKNRILDKHPDSNLRNFAGPCHWNYMDILEEGNGMREYEDSAPLSISAIIASTLILGT